MFKSEAHNVFTEKVSKITIIANDDKRQSFNSVKSYRYGTTVGKVCKEELLEHIRTKKLHIKDE